MATDPVTTAIPVEITALIFEYYILSRRKEGDLADNPTFGFDEIPAGAPLHLGAVSRAWREIAWGTPALWTNLVVDLMSKGHSHGPVIIQEWLYRTPDLPVNVALRLHTDVRVRHQNSPVVLEGERKRNAETIVELLNKHWPRLKSLDLTDVPWHLSVLLNSNDPSALDNLCLGGFGNEVGLGTHVPLFSDTAHKPSPRAFSLVTAIPPLLVNIDWSKMTTLSIDDLTREGAFEIISLCATTLRTLTIKAISDDIDDEFDGWLPGRVILLPHLLSISYLEMGSQRGFCTILFNHITAPALRSIMYTGMEEENEMPVKAITSFIRRSSCSILAFILQLPSFYGSDDNAYIPLLRAMSKLRMLDVSLLDDISVEPLFSALGERHPETDRPTFLPRLRKFNCRVHPNFEWALFPEIFMGTDPEGHRIGDEGFKLSNIYVAPARRGLITRLLVHGPLDEEDFVDSEALLALLALKGQIYTDIEVMTDSNGRESLDGLKFLEKSFKMCFFSDPKRIQPVFVSMYNCYKETCLF